MSSKRSRLEIYVDILDAIHQGYSKPTKIMYTARLGWTPLCTMLDSSKTQELIENIPVDIQDKRTKIMYKISKRGLNVLDYYNKARTLFSTDLPLESELKTIVRQ